MVWFRRWANTSEAMAVGVFVLPIPLIHRKNTTAQQGRDVNHYKRTELEDSGLALWKNV